MVTAQTLGLPTFYFGSAAQAVAERHIVAFTITDKPLSANDELSITLDNAAYPHDFPGERYMRVTGFGDYYFDTRMQDEDLPGVSTLKATRRNYFGADAATKVLTFLENNGIRLPFLTRTPALRRWNTMATRPPVVSEDGEIPDDPRGFQRLVAQQMNDKGSTPNLDQLRRGLIERGLMLIEGNHNGGFVDLDGVGNGLSVVALEYNRNGEDADGNEIVKNLPSGTAIRGHNEPLIPALSRRLEFSALGEIIGAGAHDADHLGNFDRVNYGVIALEQRRYHDLLTQETASADIDYDTGYKVADIVRDAQMRQWRITGAQHVYADSVFETKLDLTRRFTPTAEQLRENSPPPFNARAVRLEELPTAPTVTEVATLTDINGEFQTADVGGAMAFEVAPTDDAGKPIRSVRLHIVNADGEVVRNDEVPFNGYQPTLQARYLGMSAEAHTINASYVNEYGTSPPTPILLTPSSQPPILLDPLLLTTLDNQAAQNQPDGLLGAAGSKAVRQRLAASVRRGAYDDTDMSPRFRRALTARNTLTLLFEAELDAVGLYIPQFSPLESFVGLIRWLSEDDLFTAYVVAFVNVNSRGTKRVAARGQYRVGTAIGGTVESDADITWQPWQNWGNGNRPRGTLTSPNPVPLSGEETASSDTDWVFVMHIGGLGVNGAGQSLSAHSIENPFISMRFWAASVDQNGNEVGSPTDDQYVYIKTINCRHWFDDNAQAHDGVGIRHFTNNGELTPAGQNVVFYRE